MSTFLDKFKKKIIETLFDVNIPSVLQIIIMSYVEVLPYEHVKTIYHETPGTIIIHDKVYTLNGKEIYPCEEKNIVVDDINKYVSVKYNIYYTDDDEFDYKRICLNGVDTLKDVRVYGYVLCEDDMYILGIIPYKNYLTKHEKNKCKVYKYNMKCKTIQCITTTDYGDLYITKKYIMIYVGDSQKLIIYDKHTGKKLSKKNIKSYPCHITDSHVYIRAYTKKLLIFDINTLMCVAKQDIMTGCVFGEHVYCITSSKQFGDGMRESSIYKYIY